MIYIIYSVAVALEHSWTLRVSPRFAALAALLSLRRSVSMIYSVVIALEHKLDSGVVRGRRVPRAFGFRRSKPFPLGLSVSCGLRASFHFPLRGFRETNPPQRRPARGGAR